VSPLLAPILALDYSVDDRPTSATQHLGLAHADTDNEGELSASDDAQLAGFGFRRFCCKACSARGSCAALAGCTHCNCLITPRFSQRRLLAQCCCWSRWWHAPPLLRSTLLTLSLRLAVPHTSTAILPKATPRSPGQAPSVPNPSTTRRAEGPSSGALTKGARLLAVLHRATHASKLLTTMASAVARTVGRAPPVHAALGPGCEASQHSWLGLLTDPGRFQFMCLRLRQVRHHTVL
jgi:hypothetical protein